MLFKFKRICVSLLQYENNATQLWSRISAIQLFICHFIFLYACLTHINVYDRCLHSHWKVFATDLTSKRAYHWSHL